MRTVFDNVNLFDRQSPERLVRGVRPQFAVGQTTRLAGMNLDVRRAELVKVFVEVILPLLDDRGRVRMNDDGVFEAVDGQSGDAIGVAVEEAISRQVRPLRERRPPTDGVSDRTRPGD